MISLVLKGTDQNSKQPETHILLTLGHPGWGKGLGRGLDLPSGQFFWLTVVAYTEGSKQFYRRKLDRDHCTRRKLNGNHCHVAVQCVCTGKRQSCKNHQLNQMLHTPGTWDTISALWTNLTQWPDIFQGGMLLESHICVWLLQQQIIQYGTVRPYHEDGYLKVSPAEGGHVWHQCHYFSQH